MIKSENSLRACNAKTVAQPHFNSDHSDPERPYKHFIWTVMQRSVSN